MGGRSGGSGGGAKTRTEKSGINETNIKRILKRLSEQNNDFTHISDIAKELKLEYNSKNKKELWDTINELSKKDEVTVNSAIDLKELKPSQIRWQREIPGSNGLLPDDSFLSLE